MMLHPLGPPGPQIVTSRDALARRGNPLHYMLQSVMILLVENLSCANGFGIALNEMDKILTRDVCVVNRQVATN